MDPGKPLFDQLKRAVIGAPRSLHDRKIFHKLSLIAFFAWIGLGADGLSSSCYGPQESFLALHGHIYLGLFVALATALTVFVISTSYSQIIDLFPTGGGGYLVASKLLTPRVGMVSGCALMVDYVLTITVSIASGADALFSFFPPDWQPYKLGAAVAAIFMLTLMNLRGVKESIAPLIPIFLIFLITHAFVIVYTISTHAGDFGPLAASAAADVRDARSQLGVLGVVFLIMHAYSMGAGTYTGIEAVSNGLPILREPRVETGKRTMHYMWISLAFMAVGLMISYLLFGVRHEENRTLNAVLLERVSAGWGQAGGRSFVVISLVSEAALLVVAAQTGFLGGPRVLASMAVDRWVPARFSMLSDRLVTQNGVLLMSVAALVTMVLTGGSVGYLVVLYSINVFITFTLSQMGMVRHWWSVRRETKDWARRLSINGIGLLMTAFILVWVTVAKFHQGGWVTLLVTTGLVTVVSLIRRHYNHDAQHMRRLDSLVESTVRAIESGAAPHPPVQFDPKAKTAVLLVGGFNGLGIHTLLNVVRFFGDTFRNFVFLRIGIIDAGNFKGVKEIRQIERQLEEEGERYVAYMKKHGIFAEGV